MTTINLYTREDCPLCDRALRELEEARDGLPPFDLRVIDIESDPALHRLYLERIPVFASNGSILCELGLDVDAVRAALTE